MPTGKKTKKHKASLRRGKKLEETKPLSLAGHVNTGKHITTASLQVR
jgi:hypothetical protein